MGYVVDLRVKNSNIVKPRLKKWVIQSTHLQKKRKKKRELLTPVLRKISQKWIPLTWIDIPDYPKTRLLVKNI